MSLINDALKKAQQQRASVPAATSSVPGPQPKKKSSFRIVTVIGLCAVLLSAVSVGTTLFILHDDSAAPARAPSKPVATTLPAAPPVAAPIAVVPAPLPAASVPAEALKPALPVPLPLPMAAVSVTPSATQASTTIAFPSTSAVPPPAKPIQEPKSTVAVAPVVRPPDPTQPSPGVQGFIDKLRVAGIRVSDTESKVILNERLFRANDVIEPGLGLRLTGIDSHLLTFTDNNGFSYQKRF